MGSVELGTKGTEPLSGTRRLCHEVDHVQEGFISFSYLVSSSAPLGSKPVFALSMTSLPLAIIFSFFCWESLFIFSFSL